MTDSQEAGRVVVGVDGSESSIGALRRGIRIAQGMGIGLEAVTAWSYPPMFTGGAPGDWSPEADAQEVLEHAIAEVFPNGAPDWFGAHIAQGPSAQVLIEAGQGAEMLVVGSRGRGGFSSLLLGSVSSAVAEHATCPVLVYHHEAKEVLHSQPPAE